VPHLNSKVCKNVAQTLFTTAALTSLASMPRVIFKKKNLWLPESKYPDPDIKAENNFKPSTFHHSE
jgi:hypothetical protein